MILETSRLLLRPITEDDLDMVYEYSKGPNVGPNAGWKPHESKDETLEIMRAIFIGQDNVWGIVLKETGRLIGTIGLIHDPKRQNEKARMLGYAIGEAYWGRGLTTEAASEAIRYGFEDCGFALLSAYCYPHNTRSKRVLEKCGMSCEGCLRKAERLYDGTVLDHLCFSIAKEDRALSQQA